MGDQLGDLWDEEGEENAKRKGSALVDWTL